MRRPVFCMFFILAALLAVAGCPSQEFFPSCTDPAHPCPPVEPNYPASSAVVVEEEDGSPQALSSPCGKACENLRKVGCPEGLPTNGVSCYRGCVSMAKHQRIPTVCWATRSTRDEVRACGAIRCLTK